MEITKHNVCEHIDNILKSLKIRYSILYPDSKGCLYELYVSSIIGNIQVEYDLDNEDDNYFVLQFFTNLNSLYHSEWDNETPGDSIEGEIENLVESIKKINQGASKIQMKIEQIKNICEEYELNFEDFIDVLYDFDS